MQERWHLATAVVLVSSSLQSVLSAGSLKSTSTVLCYFTASGHGAKQAAVLFRMDISADVTYKSIFQSPSLESELIVHAAVAATQRHW